MAGVRRGRGLSPQQRRPLGISMKIANNFSFSQPPCDTKGPLRRKEGSGGGGGGGGEGL